MEATTILNNLIKSRRSVFTPMFTGEKVDETIIQQMLENANWAPNHRMTEPWRFIIFKDAGLQKLSDYQKNYYINNTPAEKQTERKLKKTINNALKSSHVIALCIQRDPEGRVPEWEELAALSCAIQNMYLTATAYEVGCYWSTPASASDASEFLNMRKDEICYGWFYVGVPQPGLNLPAKRGDVSLKIKWISE